MSKISRRRKVVGTAGGTGSLDTSSSNLLVSGEEEDGVELVCAKDEPVVAKKLEVGWRNSFWSLWRCCINCVQIEKLPSSLPKNFPNHTEEDLRERPSRIIEVGKPQAFHFRDNFVKTSKYEIWNFLPKFLFEEFNPKTKIANIYFLVISCLQCVRAVSNTNGIPTTLIPLSFVVIVDAFFQIVEDVARHKADEDANASLAHKYDGKLKKISNMRWRDLAVGDVIQIFSREIVPADVLIIGTVEKSGAGSEGVCYAETKSLDGETNLKLKCAIPSTCSHVGTTTDSVIKFLSTLSGEIDMEHPNNLIETFSGVCEFTNYKREAIEPKNVLLRGCVLRNTEFIVGVVLNTGHDTKIMMSSTCTPSKTSVLETEATGQVQRIIALLLLICFTGATGQAIWNNDLAVTIQDIWYLKWDPEEGSTWVNQFFYFFLLHATFIPVSLYVSMSAARYFQSKFMNLDPDMYHEHTKTHALVRTMTLNEELGQISHIFTDKTGTLTCNIMDFRKASIGGVSYGEGITEVGRVAWQLQGKQLPETTLKYECLAKENSVPHVSFYSHHYQEAIKSDSLVKRRCEFFWKVLAACHDIVPEHTGGCIILSASNPDDEANVAAAKYFGFEFIDREHSMIVIYNHHTGKNEEFELLVTIGFSSKRKRMSVIVRVVETGDILLLTKGADSVILDRLSKDVRESYSKFSLNTDFANQEEILLRTKDHLNQYAVEGLRCLLVSYRRIDLEEFNEWYTQYSIASRSLTQIESMKKGAKNDIEDLQEYIENNLILLGCTAIEDRLQEGVSNCISLLVAAGINIWMLTGDKEETAINIAIACNILQPQEHMKHVIVNDFTCPTKHDTIRLLESEMFKYSRDLEKGTQCPRALIIDGPSLVKVMLDNKSTSLLLAFGKCCKAVVGCRVSPDQKKEMITLIKNGVGDIRTLAVGDGANDVAMIQAAHVGVGIKGEEGLQAVNSADFAIAQFQYLAPLLLKHGRNNYIRLSSLIVYMFYKNLLMSLCQFCFAFLNGFSGQKFYTEGGIQLFNVIFTSFPILILGAIDVDLTYQTVSTYPQIYRDCIRNAYFRTPRVWFWLFQAAVEAIVCTALSLLLLHNSEEDFGSSSTLWEAGALCFTAVVIICSLKMFVLQHRINLFHLLVLLASILSWALIASLINIVVRIDYNWNYIWFALMQSKTFWVVLLIIVTAVVIKDAMFCFIDRYMLTRSVHALQEEECKLKIHRSRNNAASSTSRAISTAFEKSASQGSGVESRV